jgi:hypothetical protein
LTIRCAIYTRKSTEEGLEQEFNMLDAQRDAAEAFIRRQRGEGWVALPDHYALWVRWRGSTAEHSRSTNHAVAPAPLFVYLGRGWTP